ncbi:hypothetical protein CCR75_009715 [Bremia lactucae]|uniref:Reverse transcriptase RNase H-like domain-containing protein n=1 Tax=Bremia lactucae TaxID=4779 RepID=A0A976FH26_BRELC|nr:hypothetical protein CCR75_009715 [Bremia lactucae]
MYSSIAGPWTVRRTWKFIKLTFVRFLHLCESISCMQISRSVYSLQAKYHFLDASLVNAAYALIPKRSKQSPTGQFQSTSRVLKGSFVYSGALAQVLSQLCRDDSSSLSSLEKDEKWLWNADCQRSFEGIKQSLMQSPILAIADQDRPFHVVCDASDFAIGCALMQYDTDGAERVVCYQSRQLQPAERNYPVHDKELLAMKYSLAKFRVFLKGDRPFIVYTDHVSLRTAVNSPHLSQRMARWLSFFAEYNFSVEYKPGRLNVFADALSRRPDFESAVHPNSESDLTVATLTTSVPSSTLVDDIKKAYKEDKDLLCLMDHLRNPSDKSYKDLPALYRSSSDRHTTRNG